MNGTARSRSRAASAAFTRVSRRADSLAPLAPGWLATTASGGRLSGLLVSGLSPQPADCLRAGKPVETGSSGSRRYGPGATGARLSALRETRVNAALSAPDPIRGVPLI